MRRLIKIIIIVPLVVGVLFIFNCHKFKKIEHRKTSELQDISALLPKSPTQVMEAIKSSFNSGSDYTSQKFSQDNKFAHLRLYDSSNPLFQDVQERLVYYMSTNKSSEIRTYAAMPIALKSNDFYLYEPTGDCYWDSEYYYQDKPAPFITSFIIHLDSAGNNQTKIQIFELSPQIHIGEYIGFGGHSGPFPGKFWDIREVEPTVSDKIDVLSVIKANLK
jgi:hypothetical protein